MLVIFISLALVSWLGWQVFKTGSSSAEIVQFKIIEGQGVNQIAEALKQSELIQNKLAFATWVYFNRNESKFVAGDFRFSKSTSVYNLVKMLTGGLQPTSEINVTLIEGWTIKEIATYLDTKGVYDYNDFVKLVVEPQQFNLLLSRLGITLSSKPVGASLEGYLFPDTYRIFSDSDPDELVGKMLNNFVSKVDAKWIEDLEVRKYNLWQGIIMASIIEREVSSDKDRALVADIFWRRLEAGRGLEADSTINYVTGNKTPAVSLTDTKLDSPYNTYKYRGLPPGPISNPGLAAIRAAVYPQSNEYWYFLSTPAGDTIFSTTFEEHIAAKNKYLR